MSFNYSSFPNQNMVPGLKRYLESGVIPGSFMKAVLENDLKSACALADTLNQTLLFDTVVWLYNEVPTRSWGSKEAVEAWAAKKAR